MYERKEKERTHIYSMKGQMYLFFFLLSRLLFLSPISFRSSLLYTLSVRNRSIGFALWTYVLSVDYMFTCTHGIIILPAKTQFSIQ